MHVKSQYTSGKSDFIHMFHNATICNDDNRFHTQIHNATLCNDDNRFHTHVSQHDFM